MVRKTATQLDREINTALSKSRRKTAAQPATSPDHPYRNSQQDVSDAFEYMRETADDWPTDACSTENRETMPLSKILNYDDYSAWGEWSAGELRGLKADELLAALIGFRGRAWAETVAGWLAGTRTHENIPAVVLFDSKYGTAIADGRGRVSLAAGLKLPRLYVTRIVDCK